MNLKYLLISICIILQACSSSAEKPSKPVTEQVVSIEVKGQAAIKDGARLLARKMAIQDAIRQASLQNNSHINSRTVIKQNSIELDSYTLTTSALISHSQVIDEWTKAGIYHIRALVHLSSANKCTSQYRKGIAATAFPLVQASHTSMSESNDLSTGIPREIANILTESGAYLGRNKTRINLYKDPGLAPEMIDLHPFNISADITLAEQSRVQFILSGVIRDLEKSPSHYNRGSGFIAWLKSFTRYFNATRNISFDVYVHDGYSGALLFQHRYKETATGDIWIPENTMVGSEQFKATDTGNKITELMNQSVRDIHQALVCYPFQARIVDIKDNKVFIDAGTLKGVKPGDQLVIYNSLGLITKQRGTQEAIGLYNEPAGVISITETKPEFAIGQLEAPAQLLGIRKGDWVKSW